MGLSSEVEAYQALQVIQKVLSSRLCPSPSPAYRASALPFSQVTCPMGSPRGAERRQNHVTVKSQE